MYIIGRKAYVSYLICSIFLMKYHFSIQNEFHSPFYEQNFPTLWVFEVMQNFETKSGDIMYEIPLQKSGWSLCLTMVFSEILFLGIVFERTISQINVFFEDLFRIWSTKLKRWQVSTNTLSVVLTISIEEELFIGQFLDKYSHPKSVASIDELASAWKFPCKMSSCFSNSSNSCKKMKSSTPSFLRNQTNVSILLP